MSDLKGIKATLTRYQVQLIAQTVPDKAVSDLWFGLLADYPSDPIFYVMANGARQ